MKSLHITKANICDLLKYILALSLSCGVILNLFGIKIVLIEMTALFLLCKKKIMNYSWIGIAIIFLIIILIKCIALIGVENVRSGFHGFSTHIIGISIFLFTYFLLPTLVNEINNSRRKVYERFRTIFLSGYNLTIMYTLLYLYQHSRNAYRNGSINEDVFCAPFFFLFYAMMFVFLHWVRIINNKGRISYNTIGLLFNLFVVFSFNYMTQFIFTIVGLVVYYIFVTKKTPVFYILCIIGICIVIPLSLYLPYIIRFIADTFFQNNLTYYLRMMDMSNFLNGIEDNLYDLGGRIRLCLISYETFKSNILFGISFDLYNNNQIFGRSLNIGGHFEWMDDLARYGVIGCFALVYLIIKGFSIFCKQVNWGKSIYYASLMVIFLYGAFNPVLKFGLETSLLIAGIIYSSSNRVNKYEREIYENKFDNTDI